MHYYGDFYRLSASFCCRSTLEIVHREQAPDSLCHLASRQPDVVVVMANPGGSRPCCGDDGSVIEPSSIWNPANLVETVPDRTQRVVERMMEEKGYSHVRVLNLSDIREPSLGTLVQRLGSDDLPDGDSLFCCPSRREEFDHRLNPRLDLVIAAWGYEDDTNFTHRANAAYDEALRRGLTVLGSGGRFAHPSRNRDWVSDLVSKLP